MELLQRIGFGRLIGASWLSNNEILLATTAGLFRYDKVSGQWSEYMCRFIGTCHHSREHELVACMVEGPREILVLSTKDGSLVQKLEAHGKQLVKCVAISPDGKLVASGGSDRMLRIRSISDSAEVLTIEHPGGFLSMDGNPDNVCWSPDGSLIATADKDGIVYLWQADGKAIGKWKAGRWVFKLSFTPDGKQIVTASNPPSATVGAEDRHLHVWQLDGKNVASTHLPNSKGWVEEQRSLAFSVNGSLLASGGRGGTVHLVDTSSWERKCFITEEKVDPYNETNQRLKLCVQILDFSPDGKELLVGTTPCSNLGMGEDIISLQTYRCDEWARTWCLNDFVSQVNDICLSSDGSLAVAVDTGTRIYDDSGTFKKVNELNANKIDLSPDGTKLCIGTSNFQGEAVVVDVKSQKVEQELSVLKSRVDDIDLSPDGVHLATAVDDVRIWKLGRKSVVKKLKVINPKGLAFSSDGALLAVASWKEAVKIWTVPKGKMQIELVPTKAGRFTAVAFSPDDSLVAGVGYEGKAYVWQAKDGKLVATLGSDNEKAALWSVTFSPDGKLLVDGSWESGTIRVWNTSDWTQVKSWRSHGEKINKLLFCQDGSKLYSASSDGCICIWDVSQLD